MVMTHRKMLRLIDSDRIREAIQKAERRTSGEICVSVSRLFWGNVEKAADKAFGRLGMTKTKDRNGVLFFVVPSRRRFVVLGDEGIHAKVGHDFWQRVASRVSEHFGHGEFTTGLLKGIEEVGEQLAAHFPYDSTADVDELTDDVDFE
jgi:uncharacterized membrane protein